MIRRFFSGVFIPFRALKLIVSHFDLFFLSLLPALLTTAIYTLLFSKVHRLIVDFQNSMATNIPEFMKSAFFGLTHLILGLVAAITFSFVVTLVAVPFNDFLARQTEKKLKMNDLPKATWTLTLRLIWIDAAKTALAGGLGFLFLIFSWIPIINILTGIGSCLLITFQYLTYPQTRRLETMGDAFTFIVSNFAPCLGMGLSFFLLFQIPFSSGFLLPFAVVSGTLLYSERVGRYT